MFKLRRRTRPETQSTPSMELQQTKTMSPVNYEFLATFNNAGHSNHCSDEDSGIYTMCADDDFAVLRDHQQPQAKASIRATAARRVPKVIAVIQEPDGQSRFFHPELSRRAGRPVWAPLQPLEG